MTAECLTSLDLEPELPKVTWKDVPSWMIEYNWQVLAPELPKNSKEIFWEEKQEIPSEGEHTVGKNAKGKKKKPQVKVIKRSYNPKVYQLKDRKLIAVNENDDLSDAIKLKNKSFPMADIVLNKVG